MARKSFVLMVMGTILFFLCSVSSADVPDSINYQGKLTTAQGGCLNDTVSMTFSIYPDILGSPSVWTETQTQVVVENGIFSVLLGSVNPIPDTLFDGSAKYLGVQVESDPEMTPLKPMVSVAYAFHSTTADTAYNVVSAGLISVDGVSNPGGDVDLIETNAINITPNDGANTITFGETHSARTDNPHGVTAAQAGALVSTDGVSNPGGDVDLIPQDAITITPNDPANTITIGETHSTRTDNPHGVTAAQTGALVSTDGVSNPGGDVDFIPQNAITITPNDGNNTITVGETHSARTDNPHTVTATQTGALVSVDGVSNPGGDVDFIAGANMVITPDPTGDSIVFSSAPASYAQVFTVALSGGDFTTISGALGACVNPGSNNSYLIRVMPGVYNESVVCSSFVRLQGAGKYVCYITGSVTGANNCTIDGFNIAEGMYCTGTSPTITHNIITSSGAGIRITDEGKPWIKENEVIDCVGAGIYCNGWGTDAWIIANKIERNMEGIHCTHSSPTISNNQILENEDYGIFLIGIMDQPSEPTIDDNVIGRTEVGVGIRMVGYAEPRIIANDIWVNYTGIQIEGHTQPSILANNINYNSSGIRCFSSGASKPPTIKSNHIHSNSMVGLDIINASPIVTHNNINFNCPMGINPDIQYVGGPFPMISLNVFDIIIVQGSGATGSFNVTSGGVPIAP